MADSSQEKTEQPTGKRLGEARRKGNVARSMDLNSVFVLLAGGCAIYLSVGKIHKHFEIILTETWSEGFRVTTGYTPDVTLFLKMITHFFLMILPTVATCMITALLISFIQLGGFMISFETIRPQFAKLNPFTGISRFFSLHSLVELFKSVLKLVIISYAVYAVVRSEEELILNLVKADIGDVLRAIGHLCLRVLYRVGGIMIFLGLLDYAFQRWKYKKDLKMTKQEVKEEQKQAENMEVKGRIRSIRMQLYRKRMMANIPKASVVITNPTHFAVALQYEPGMSAPKVVAKGVDHLALKIIEIARASKVPVVQNPPLARALYKEVKLDDVIPLALYKAVAKVLAYIYQQKRQRA